MTGREKKYEACLLGLAVGDALGTTLEFKSPGSFDPLETIVGGGPFCLKPGEWTDDTSMALCLAESLLKCKGFNAVDQMERYCRWMNDGYFSSNGVCFDIGNTVVSALRKFQLSGNPIAGSSDKYSAGNGSIMRLAPVVMAYASDARQAIQAAAMSSVTTHRAEEAVDACRLMAAILYGAFNGVEKEALLNSYTPCLGIWDENPLCEKIQNTASGNYIKKNPPYIQGSGYVVKSLEAALWAFEQTNNFRDGALLAVNLGDDADTTGAVYGQIAGAYYGEIPEDWYLEVCERPVIEVIARKLYQLSNNSPELK